MSAPVEYDLKIVIIFLTIMFVFSIAAYRRKRYLLAMGMAVCISVQITCWVFLFHIKQEDKIYPPDVVLSFLRSQDVGERKAGYSGCVMLTPSILEEETLESIKVEMASNIQKPNISTSELFLALYALSRNAMILPDTIPKSIIDAAANQKYDHGIRTLSLKVIALYGPRGHEAIPVLEDIVCGTDDSKKKWANYAAQAIGAIGPPASDSTISALVCGVKSKRFSLSYNCARALAKLGDPGVAALRKLTLSDDEEIAGNAKSALKTVEASP